jgi:xanthine dehydrogenase YagS FAD-binding subunit
MRPFAYQRPRDTGAAVAAASATRTPRGTASVHAPAQFIAGGTTMLDLMKLDVMRPRRLIDLGLLADAEEQHAEVSEAGLRLGAMLRMADAADDAKIRADYPVIADSLRLAASGQIRNMATLGGNVLQRTRCLYFRDTAWTACNKRDPGSGCAAREGINRMHAVLGTSDHCIATYPGDFAQALIALDAQVEINGRNGGRVVPFAALHRTPGDTPHLEHTLAPGDLIIAFEIPDTPFARRSLYLKIRDRESYEFALASAAVALDLDGTTVKDVRIALGGVATVPWRAHEAEAQLRGRPLNADTLAEAVEAAFAEASPRTHNAFKIELGKRTMARAVLMAAAMEI